MNTANWVPDLFMKRVAEDGMWSLFSPDETPDLHVFYRLKHAIREVEAAGSQGHVPGLTQENWKTVLCDICRDWLKSHPRPEPFAND